MIKTIAIGNYVSVQGLFVGTAEDGRLIVKVDDRTYIGRSVGN